MLSISQRKIPGTVIQQVMSAATGSPVRKKSLIQQEIARSAGYESFEQAQALNDRSLMILEKLWVERSYANNNLWTIRAVNMKIIIDTSVGKILIECIDGEEISATTLPFSMKGFNFDESHIEFCPKLKKVIFSIRDKGHKVVFQRISKKELGISIHGVDAGHQSKITFDDSDFNQVNSWMSNYQTARTLAECVMICDDNTSVEAGANALGFTGVSMSASEDTALWLFEKGKGYTGDDIDALEPKVKAVKSMGFFAHLYLEKYYKDNTFATKELCESMSIEVEDLNDVRCRAKAEADWFLLTYIKS